jgi:hypothetical protein
VGEKVEVAKQILRAPKNSNGQNLCPNVEKSPAAYLSSVIASANDPHVEKFFDGLHAPIIDSYDRYVTMTDLDPTKPSPVSSIIVSDKSKLLSTQYISRIFKKFHTRFGIMGVLTRFCQSIRLQALRQSGVNLAESNEGSMTRQTRSDAIHILASTTRGRLGGLACADILLFGTIGLNLTPFVPLCATISIYLTMLSMMVMCTLILVIRFNTVLLMISSLIRVVIMLLHASTAIAPGLLHTHGCEIL